MEERARQARYGFLEEVREGFFAQKIALGHSLNDQAETVLMRLLRGSGLSGLAGIPPVRGGFIIRPLIGITREEIMGYIERKGLRFVTDSSNFETRFLRNRIRLEILPGLMKIQPRIIELLGQTSEIMRREDEWVEAESEEWVKTNCDTGANKEVVIPLASFNRLPEALRFRGIRNVLRNRGGTLRRLSTAHIEAINRLATAHKPQACLDLPNDLVVKRTYGKLIFLKGKEQASGSFSYTLDRPGEFDLTELNCTVLLEEIEPAEPPDRHTSQWTAYLNADQITYPLVIRDFRPGDRFIPYGMKGHKKLKDFFIDLKIPAKDRAKIPILTLDDRPVWICGFRIDDRFKITSHTRKALKVAMTTPHLPSNFLIPSR